MPKSGRQFSAFALSLGIGLSAWLIGFLSVLCQLFAGLRRLTGIENHSIPLEKGALEAAEDARREIGLRRPVRFLRAAETSTIAVPVTWGLSCPTVLLPAQSRAWSDACLRAALLHELAHVSRWDWATQVAGRLVCAVYWWHPLVWLASRQAREESEHACDDSVLRTGVKAADYAQRLIEVVRSMPEGAPSRTVAIAMAQPSEVEGRLQAVLARGRNRKPLNGSVSIAALMVVGVTASSLAALQLTSSAEAMGASRPPTQVLQGIPAPSTGIGEEPASASDTVVVANGSRAVLSNGYEVALAGVTQATRTGDEWDMYGGPWWTPEGKPIAPQTGGMDGHWHWSVAHTHGLPPFVFKAVIRPPGSQWKPRESSDTSFFQQFLGALKPADNAVETRLVTGGPHPTDRDTASSLADGSAPQHFDGPVSGTRCAELYPTGTRTCTVRCGVAAGPWHTVTAHPSTPTPSSNTAGRSQSTHFTTVSLALDGKPRVICLDDRGGPRVFSFVGTLGRLSYVAWRLDAVDISGHTVPLIELLKNGESQGAELSLRAKSDAATWTTRVDPIQIKEFRLEMRPYETVEFRNVQLQPSANMQGAQPSSAMLLAQTSEVQIAQAKLLRAHLQNWARANGAILQQMAHAQPNDLSALMRVYDSFQRLPIPLWDGDPRLGHGSEDPLFAIEVPSRLTQTHLQRSQDSVETRMRRDFAQFHDFAIAQSVNVGRSHITVWASGRITQTTATDRFLGHGQPIGTEESQQEIVAPFFSSETSAESGAKAIRTAYTVGEGRMGILNIPVAWRADQRSYRSTLRLLNVTISGRHALATTRQVDSVTATDPKTGRTHQATAEAVFEGSWEKSKRGWFARSFQLTSFVDKIDGVRLTGSDGKMKNFFVSTRVRTPLPSSYPYWN